MISCLNFNGISLNFNGIFLYSRLLLKITDVNIIFIQPSSSLILLQDCMTIGANIPKIKLF